MQIKVNANQNPKTMKGAGPINNTPFSNLPFTNTTFPLGEIAATPGVMNLLTYQEVYMLLARHFMSDWEDITQDDKDTNDQALVSEDRLFSSYVTPNGKVWIITEADRSVTTALLPSEY